MLAFPAIFGGDTILRLANHEHILLSYQLPLLQSVVWGVSRVTTDPFLVRVVLSVIGAGAGVAVAAMLLPLMDRRAALAGGYFFAAHPYIMPLSTVPYQETLMVGLLALAFACAFRQRWPWASLAMAGACMTRYEAWLAVPALAVLFAWRERLAWPRLATGLLMFGWAPLAWIAIHGGITPRGTFAVEGTMSLERLWRWAYLGWTTVRLTPLPVLALAALGAWAMVRRGAWRDRRWQALATYLALFLLALLASAHGVGDNPERMVTSREAHVPQTAIVGLAALGLTLLPRWRRLVVGAGVVAGLLMAVRFTHDAVHEPGLAVSVEAAAALDTLVTAGEHVVVLTAPITGAERYVEQVARREGPDGRRRAMAVLRSLETTPPGYQRILVHSHLGKDQLRTLATLWVSGEPVRPPPTEPGCPDWVVAWDDFTPSNEAERALAAALFGASPVVTQARGEVAVRIYRLAP